MEDMEDMCMKFGAPLEIKIPKPAGVRSSPAVGCVFVKFETVEIAVRAWQGLAGSSYDCRTCVTSFVGEESFDCDGW